MTQKTQPINSQFEYSEFQKKAIHSIEEGHHTLITAHTGSGKTLPAEYAIEYFTKRGKKVIYTSPIKALSNQKYNDFTKKFSHLKIGLLTGDNKHNPGADVLIMTTEILQNNLFHLSNKKTNLLDFTMDMENELACVVFDEVHYIDDAERGTVWEQTMILLPNHVQFIMLSATIGEKEKFAGWIESIKDKKVTICGTNERVVPLTYYSFFTYHEKVISENNTDKNKNKNKLTKENKTLLESKHNKLEIIKSDKYYEQTLITNKKCMELVKDEKIHPKFVINELCKVLREKEMFPALFFVFSRKKVEEIANDITFPLFEEGEKDYEIGNVCKQLIVSRVTNWKEYIMLPEYADYMKLLTKGIGIHHAGMLPIFREMIEILYEKRYIKVLVATETFAIGLNMPTKTVCFTSLYKYDTSLRTLHPHEFIQMSGRAGRRNIDTIGHVILMTNLYEPLDSTKYYKLFNSEPKVLTSKFKIGYDLVLQMNKEELVPFVKKSMMYQDIVYDIEYNKRRLKEKEEECQQFSLGDKIKICQSYLQLKEDLGMSKNKMRRQILSQIHDIESCDDFMYHLGMYQKRKELEKEIKEYEDYIWYCENYVELKVNNMYQIIEENNFFTEPYYTIASSIHEIHPLVYTDLCLKYNYFEKLSSTDLFCLFSCFYPFKGDNGPTFLKDELHFIQTRIHHYNDREMSLDLTQTTCELKYDGMLYIKQWMEDCNNEIKSVQLLNQMKEDIFCGDFIKCCLKIINMCKEIEKTLDLSNAYDLREKIEEGKSKMMKFICTNQSLYL
jgi:superfamily II RNA helicase